MPTVDEILRQMEGAKFFTEVDLSPTYPFRRVYLKVEDRESKVKVERKNRVSTAKSRESIAKNRESTNFIVSI